MANLTPTQYPETPYFTTSTSKTVTIKGCHKFKIQGYSLTKGMGVGKYISSDTFFVGGHLWALLFFPDGDKKNDESGDSNVSLFITLLSKYKEEVRIFLECVLLDQSGDKWYKSTSGFYRMPKDGSEIGLSPFFKRSELEASQFLKDDCLTIQCTVGVLKTSLDVPKTFAQPLPLSDLGQSYMHLLESRDGSDLSFEVEGQIIYAHKLILSTRSPVFKAQFFGPLKEDNTQCIKIEEMHAPVFKALLRFIYCDVIPNLDSKCVDTTMTQHLLAAANRYGIEKLRSLCEARLCENIDIDTVASNLALAEQHGCIQLKSMCLEFIGLPENLEGVMRTDGFKNLKASCPAVIDELLKFVARIRDYSCVFYANEPRPLAAWGRPSQAADGLGSPVPGRGGLGLDDPGHPRPGICNPRPPAAWDRRSQADGGLGSWLGGGGFTGGMGLGGGEG
ncbi:hypothetical protein RD792_002034 [Penstemon davidsonii]|uniref:Uncharacterized protein n=1 Tax=Penstemon davidsonii TaxID=160366 RepID=A0ABR0DPZ1_9LAMI|nr:hypothetical protein RD792_002034 [Penstemon davidsonii]